MYQCRPEDTLQSVIEKFIRSGVHRLIVVDGGQKVVGMVSLSDVLRFLITNA